MTIIKKIITVFTVVTFILFSQAPSADAAVMTTYGGLSVGLIPCPGLGSTVYALNVFAPLYLNSPEPLGGLLGVPPAIAFAGYKIHPGVWALGTFVPGAAICIIGICPYCVYVPNLGMILPFSGASLL